MNPSSGARRGNAVAKRYRLAPFARARRVRSSTARLCSLGGRRRIFSRECWPSPKSQLGSPHAPTVLPREFQEAAGSHDQGPYGPPACKSRRWRSVLDSGLLSVASRIGHADVRRRKPEIVCADLVAFSCGQVLHGSPPSGRRFDRAGCAGLIAALCRSGQVNRNLRRQTSRCSGSPVGGLRARPEGSVVGPRGNHEPRC